MKIKDLTYYDAFKSSLEDISVLDILEQVEEDRKTILTPMEIKNLSLIITTKEEAEQILKRNITLLNDTYHNLINRIRMVGCPHCDIKHKSHFDCDGCAWKILHDNTTTFRYPHCYNQTFGRVRLADSFVQYSCFGEYVYKDRLNKGPLKSQKNTILFLSGHAEWAFMLLNGSMEVSNKSYRKKNEH